MATRRRFVLGAVFAAGWFLPTILWMVKFTAPGYFLAFGLFAVILGCATAVTPPDAGRFFALPAAIVLAELWRWSWPFGGVPLATIPMGQVASPLAYTVRLFGSLWLAYSTVALGAAIAAWLLGHRRLAVAALAPVLIIGSLALAAPRSDYIGSLDVAVVQGGGPQGTRFSSCNARAVFERQIEATAALDGIDLDLILWPENVVNPETVDRASACAEPLLLADEPAPILAELARQHDATIVPGWFVQVDEEHNANYSEAIEPSGEVVDRYDKVRLVPFGEFVPFRGLLESVAESALPERDTMPGSEPAILVTDDATYAVNISWEIFFDHRARDGVRNGGEVILNPTNGSSYWLTQVQTQQLASTRLRAIETDRWVLQAAPTGFSAVVNPDGDIVDKISIGDQAVMVHRIERRDGQTLAVQWGAWPMMIGSLAIIAAAWLARRIRRRTEA
ncbi:MAG: apolipoprotein N-acyltransferase [Acidobacteria bacterium]|nr:apolipoprotein N-acyltransferase [Acidobacteriota bacterium]